MMAPEHRYFGVGDYCDVCHAFFCRLIVPGRAGLSPSDARGIAQWGGPGNAAEKRGSRKQMVH